MTRYKTAWGRVTVRVLVLVCVPVIAAASIAAADTSEPALKPNQVVTIAGTGAAGYSGDGGDALDARLGDFLDIAVGPDGAVYIADTQNDRLRVVDADGAIDTVEGTRARRDPQRDVEVADGWIFSPRNSPQAVAAGDDGTVYVAASENIYRIDPDGTLQVIGGGGEERFDDGEGDDSGPAVGAWIYKPSDIAVDATGNVYIADTNNDRIRRIDADGTITTVAGGGDVALDDAVGGPATEADAGPVETVAVDSRGNVYFGQEDRSRPYVWKIDPDGVLSVAAGTGAEGFSGDGGPAVDASLPSPPGGLTVDADDNLYLTDMAPGHVHKIDTEGMITTLGPAFTGYLADVAVGPDGNVYVTADGQIRMLVQGVEDPGPGPKVEVGPDPWADQRPGTVITMAGTGEAPDPDSTATAAQILVAEPSRPHSVAVAADGSLVYADTANDRVQRVDADGTVSTVAGTGEHGFSGDGGPATDAELSSPSGVAFDGNGTLYIADSGNGRVRAIDPSGTIATVAGSGREINDDADFDAALRDGGPATDAVLVDPQDVAVDDGRVYIADGRARRIRVVDPDGTIRTIAGGGDLWADEADGQPATDADLWTLEAVAVDAGGNVYFTGDGLPAVRKVDPEGTLTTVAGDAYLDPRQGGFAGDGGPATQAELNEPRDLAIGPDGALYIADTFNGRIRRVDADGEITTIAGTGERSDSGDEGPATSAAVNEPEALAFDPDGNLYLAGTSSDRIRRVDTDGVIATVANLADHASTGNSTRAVDTPLGGPLGLAVDPAGVLYVTETQTGFVHRIEPDGTIDNVTPLYEHHSDTPFNVAGVAYGTDGFLYVAAGGTVQRVYPDGAVVTVAGGGISEEPPDTLPQATTATLATTSLAAGPNGTLYIADAGHGQIYKLERDGGLTGVAKGERLSGGTGIAVDGAGNVYVPDQFGNAVRKVAPNGTVSMFAGTGDASYSGDGIGDGGPAVEAAVRSPRSVAVYGDHVYISTLDGIRRVDGAGTITMVVESAAEEEDGATRYDPVDMLAFDTHGNLYFSETQRNRVQVLVRPGEIGAGLQPAVLIAGSAALIAAGAFVVIWRRRRRSPDASGKDSQEERTPVNVDAGADSRRG